MNAGYYAGYYEDYWQSPHAHQAGGAFPELTAFLDEHARPGSRWLDFGCGDGTTAGTALRERGCDYTGVDIAETALARARERGFHALRIEAESRLPFEDQTFDAVLAIEVFEHLFAPQAAAAELHRVLRPGGMLFATMPNVAYWRRRVELMLAGRFDPLGDDLSRDKPWRDPHIRFFTPEIARRLLLDVGFGEVVVRGYAGAWLADFPTIGGRLNGRASTGYRVAERYFGGLLGRRIMAVARRP